MFPIGKLKHLKTDIKHLYIFDIFDLRLKFSGMTLVWIYYLVIMDLITAYGLIKLKKWGIYFFLIIALSQLVAYVVFNKYFGPQYPLIVFHLITLMIYFIFHLRSLYLHQDH